jgi:hypothetical protein
MDYEGDNGTDRSAYAGSCSSSWKSNDYTRKLKKSARSDKTNWLDKEIAGGSWNAKHGKRLKKRPLSDFRASLQGRIA